MKSSGIVPSCTNNVLGSSISNLIALLMF
jgi:hypothetical protein